MSGRINIAEKLAHFQEHWQPHIIADFNDCEVRLAKFEGPFLWHSHADTDELFLVIDGELVLEYRDRIERLSVGEMIVVPRGVEHRTNCPSECSVMILARAETKNTGEHDNERTVHQLRRI